MKDDRHLITAVIIKRPRGLSDANTFHTLECWD